LINLNIQDIHQIKKFSNVDESIWRIELNDGLQGTRRKGRFNLIFCSKFIAYGMLRDAIRISVLFNSDGTVTLGRKSRVMVVGKSIDFNEASDLFKVFGIEIEPLEKEIE